MTENDNDNDPDDPFAVPHRPERQRVRKTDDMTENDNDDTGLYGKYRVEKNGDMIDRCFVLEPDDDPAAREALLRYADATDNEALAADLRKWILHED